ncbi:hypothetical protein SDJN03_04381, partial [Cucurbita argyrosperma subsp. sororia]
MIADKEKRPVEIEDAEEANVCKLERRTGAWSEEILRTIPQRKRSAESGRKSLEKKVGETKQNSSSPFCVFTAHRANTIRVTIDPLHRLPSNLGLGRLKYMGLKPIEFSFYMGHQAQFSL